MRCGYFAALLLCGKKISAASYFTAKFPEGLTANIW
jgi:hypothetical protein